jgi:RHS repeat-associated protein
MKKILLLIILSIYTNWLLGQSCNFNQNVIVTESLCHLADTLQIKNATLVARDGIIFKPGFTVGPIQLNGHSFTAKVGPEYFTENTDYVTTVTGSQGLPPYPDYVPLTMGGVVDVSPTGAANYQLPIFVSPGSNGMQPSLSIVYSSQSGNGLLGLGWNLAGLSAITRVGKNPYYDGTVQGVELNQNDVFALDGVRLIKINDIYYPANNPYTRIEYNSNQFTLTTQDGLIMQFGHSENSRISGVGSDVPYSYALNRIIDQNGNYIDYEYIVDPLSGEYRINEIKYTGNTSGQQPYNSVKFYYSKRSDTNNFFIKGYKTPQNSLLSEIKVFCEGVLSKHYEFNNAYDLYSKLRMVTLNADGVKYAPLTINWFDNDITQNISNYTSNLYSSQLFFGNFKGNGRVDVVRYNHSGTQKILNILFGDQGSSIITLPSHATYEIPFQTVDTLNYIRDVMIVDLNSSGKSEILVQVRQHIENTIYTISESGQQVSQYTNYSAYDIVYKYTYNSSTGRFDRIVFKHITICDSSDDPYCVNNDHYRHFFVDITNDGIANHITIKDDQLISINNVNSSNAASQVGLFKDLKFIDFNGDGRVDLLFLKDNGFGSIWTVQGNTLSRILEPTKISKNEKIFFPGDFNGDGKTDYIGKNQNDEWFLRYSTGAVFVDGTLPNNLNYLVENEEFYCDNYPYYDQCYYETIQYTIPSASLVVDDFNNDGKSDILFYQSPKLFIAFSNGCSDGQNYKVANVSGLDDDQFNEGAQLSRVFYPIDIDGDGKKEILYGSLKYKIVNNNIQFQPFRKITFSLAFDNNLFVSSISDGNSNSAFTYSYFTDHSIQSTTFPLMPLHGPMKVVDNLKTLAGIILLGDVNYSYADAHIHLQGAGFLGFKEFSAYNQVSKQRVESSYEYVIPGASSVFSPWIRQVNTYVNGIATSTTTNSMGTLGGNVSLKLFMPIVSSSTSNDLIKCVSSSQSYTYNSNLGRLTQQATSVPEWTTTTSYSYSQVYNNTSRLTGVSSLTSNTEGSFEQITSLDYASGNPFRVKSKTEQGITTTFNQWDSYGNVVQVSKGERTNTNTFDPKGRFVLTTADFGGNTNTFQYRYSDGALLSETNYQGHTTTHSFSAGQSFVTTTELPDGKIVTKTLEWIGNKEGFRKKESITHGNIVTEDFNLASQKVSQTFKGYKGAIRTSTYSYNTNGSLHQEISLGVTTTYNYDDFGRPLNITNPMGTVTYSYDCLTITKNSPLAGSEVTTYDAMGNLVQVSGSNGTVNYTYFPSGLVKEIDANNGIKTEMTYDERGNQLSLKDPSAGITTFMYNAFNELEQQTSADGITTVIHYNPNGSISDKTVGGNTLVTYNYFNSGSKKGLLKEATREGVTEKFDYDIYGRPVSKIVTGVGKTFTTSYIYNQEGRLETLNYPTGLAVKYIYDEVGNVTTIFNAANNELIWSGNSKNAQEMWTRYSLGNGIETHFAYNAKYMLESISTGTYPAPKPYLYPISVFRLRYSYNDKGQLTERLEQRLSGAELKENFNYDNYNRLDLSQVLGKDPFVVSYIENGNVLSTSQSSNYDYSTTQNPYAVIEVQDPQWQTPEFSVVSSFTSDNRLHTIDNGTFINTFTYNPSGQRFLLEHIANGQKQWGKIYIDNSEFVLDANDNIQNSRTHIFAPTGICAVYEKVGATQTFYYIHTDHLGSWLAMTDGTGSLIARQSFDAWGRPRNPDTWDLLPVDLSNPTQALALQPLFDRGYTGHEHMAGFGLINMNGRVYDPYLQRFLSPDPYVQAPGNAQNYNRYSYCLNNPLMYTDPSGEFIDLALFIVGAGLMKGWFDGWDGKKMDWGKAGKGFIEGSLIAGGMVLGAYTAAGPLSLICNTMSAMYGNVGFGPFGYNVHERDFSINFGFAQWNVSDRNWNYVGKKGNSTYDNIMQGMNTLSYLSIVKGQHKSLFRVDSRKSFAGKAWQLTSRFTLEYLQTRMAMDFYNIYNNLGMIESIEGYHGSSNVRLKNSDSAMGIGNYMFVGDGFDGVGIMNPFTGLFDIDIAMHEFGHNLQSPRLGPLWLPVIGIPSLSHNIIWKLFGQNWSYYSFYTERWANFLTINRN